MAMQLARALAGFLMLVHAVGLLYFGPKLDPIDFAYGALVIVALGAFCVLPASWLVRLRAAIAVLALAAIAATFVKIHGDINLINGADTGAIVLRSMLLALLVTMLVQAFRKPGG